MIKDDPNLEREVLAQALAHGRLRIVSYEPGLTAKKATDALTRIVDPQRIRYDPSHRRGD